MIIMSLTSEQFNSIQELYESKLIVAIPGAGKTHTSITAASNIIQDNPDNRLLMVTFTNAATKEISNRLARSLNPALLERVEVRTFASIMLEHAAFLRGKRKLLLGAEQSMYVNRVLQSSEVRLKLMKALGYPANYNKHGRLIEPFKEEDYIEAVSELSEGFARVSRAYPEELSESPVDYAYRQYKELLEKHQRVDLDLISKQLLDALLAGNIEPLSFTHIIVDEFQDSDYLQYIWLLMHWEAGSHVVVIGDDDQSIYGWRGAQGIENMASFLDQFNASQYSLQACFRCAPEILNFAGTLIDCNQQRIPKKMRSMAKPGGKVSVIEFQSHDLKKLLSSEEACALLATQFGANWRQEGYTLKDLNLKKDEQPEAHKLVAAELSKEPGGWAVLARGNASLDLMEAALHELDVPTVRLGGKSIWDNESAVGLLNIMYGLCYANDPSILVNGLSWVGESEESLRDIHKQLKRTKSFELLNSMDSDWQPITKSLHAFALEFNNAPSESVGRLKDGFLRCFSQNLKNKAKVDAIEAKLNWMWRLVESYSGGMRERMARLYRASQKSNKKQQTQLEDGVVLSTMSSSKGLEWGKVWVIDVEERRSPSRITNKQYEKYMEGALEDDVEEFQGKLEEERRLLYVAMTRAERELVVSFRAGRCSPFIYQDMAMSQYVA